MSTLTSNDVYGLMEAYQAVYAPQELIEEQVWEEVETWVNTLIEEGYDLSDYTWEEMYEAYIEEQGGRRGAAVRNQNVFKFPTSSAGTRRGAAAGTRTPTPTFQNTGGYGRYGSPGTQVTTPKPTATPTAPKPAPAAPKPAAPRPAAPAPATRPAAAPAKPVGTTKPPATTTPAPATPSAPARPSLSSQVSDLQKMRARSLERQGKPLSAATASASTKPAFQANSFDLFDVVIGHLLDEGYADTEEAALVIMSNMSEEWRDSIIEGNQRNPEKDERTPKSDEAIPGQAPRKMPRRGHPDREAFEKWYAKNVR